jgi:hypothetical protein
LGRIKSLLEGLFEALFYLWITCSANKIINTMKIYGTGLMKTSRLLKLSVGSHRKWKLAEAKAIFVEILEMDLL